MSSRYQRNKQPITKEYYSLSMRHLGDSKRDWRTATNNERRVIESPTVKKNNWCLPVSVIISLLIIIATTILFLIRTPDDPNPAKRECPPGLTGLECQNMTIIGSHIWSGGKHYVLSDGNSYKRGIAFRVYAPAAERLYILVSVPGGVEEEYLMLPQAKGYWFYNVGGISSNAEFAYRIVSGSSSQIHLIQNGHYLTYSQTKRWRNTEQDIQYPISSESISSSSPPPLQNSDSNVIYTIHVPSFTIGGTYDDCSNYIHYLSLLGITTVEFMNLDVHMCSSFTSTDSLYHMNVVYPGMPHPLYGKQSSLRNLIYKIRNEGMITLLDIDLSQFSTSSDWYNYDNSANQTYFGPLLASSTFTYNERTCIKPDLRDNSVGLSLTETYLNRYIEQFGFNGFWWKGLMCFRLDNPKCEYGIGNDDMTAVRFLQMYAATKRYQYGEESSEDVKVKNKNSVIQDITNPPQNKGLGFRGGLNVTVGKQLLKATLQQRIRITTVINYLLAFNTLKETNVITYNTPEAILKLGRLIQRTKAIHPQSTLLTFKHAILIQSLFILTPGILQFFMGDEYLSEIPFAKHPQPLDLDQLGTFVNNQWISLGPRFGIFNYTQDLLLIRKKYNLFIPYQPYVYYVNSTTNTIAFLLKKQSHQFVGILNASPMQTSIIEEIDFPPLPDSDYIWSYLVNSDRHDIYNEFVTDEKPINLGLCNSFSQNHTFTACANVSIQAYSFRLYQPIIRQH